MSQGVAATAAVPLPIAGRDPKKFSHALPAFSDNPSASGVASEGGAIVSVRDYPATLLRESDEESASFNELNVATRQLIHCCANQTAELVQRLDLAHSHALATSRALLQHQIDCATGAVVTEVPTAVNYYEAQFATMYDWNERYQQLLHGRRLGAWSVNPTVQAAAARGNSLSNGWDAMSELTADFFLFCEPLAADIHMAYSQGRSGAMLAGPGSATTSTLIDALPSDLMRDQRTAPQKLAREQAASLRVPRIVGRVWFTYRHASQYVEAVQRVSQCIFEHQITGLHVPLTALMSVQGDFVTFTSLVPLASATPAAARGVLAAALRRLEASLFLPPGLTLTAHRGLDGRYYVMDVSRAVYVRSPGFGTRCIAPKPASATTTQLNGEEPLGRQTADARPVPLHILRQQMLRPANKAERSFLQDSLGGNVAARDRLVANVADRAFRRSVRRTLVREVLQGFLDTVDAALVKAKVTKDRELEKRFSAESLIEADFVAKGMKRQGLPMRELFTVLQELDQLLRRCKRDPTLAVAGNVLEDEARRKAAGMAIIRPPVRIPSPLRGTEMTTMSSDDDEEPVEVPPKKQAASSSALKKKPQIVARPEQGAAPMPAVRPVSPRKTVSIVAPPQAPASQAGFKAKPPTAKPPPQPVVSLNARPTVAAHSFLGGPVTAAPGAKPTTSATTKLPTTLDGDVPQQAVAGRPTSLTGPPTSSSA